MRFLNFSSEQPLSAAAYYENSDFHFNMTRQWTLSEEIKLQVTYAYINVFILCMFLTQILLSIHFLRQMVSEWWRLHRRFL